MLEVFFKMRFFLVDRKFFAIVLLFASFAFTVLFSANSRELTATQLPPLGQYKVAAYYFPNWHVDAVNELRGKKSWTEWDVVKAAKPRFSGHVQPKIPFWGYQMEDSPEVMAKKIDAAASHGIDAFIFDWYYHESGAYLEGALNNGFLKAANRDRIHFALMWANHKLRAESGEVSANTFKKISDHIVADYFTKPNYWNVNGKPYFSIYEIGTFITGMGGIQKAREALDNLRARSISSGLKGIHLNVVDWQIRNRPDAAKLLQILGADSVTSYTWVHHVPLKQLGFPTVDYSDVAQRYLNYVDVAKEKYGVPFYPNMTMGWDPTPRMNIDQAHDGRGYPNTPVVVGNTPERFQSVLQNLKKSMAAALPSDRIITINAWNEWGEGSYLEPDTVNGMGYLNAIQNVFSSEVKR
ncbi:MAG: glycoside hydrolase family 99-like domain-containing protein [Glaciimonas sp.]|nr:glycoside hydrolase family 99-like domain-containing protein [Glaciimonas sp.]